MITQAEIELIAIECSDPITIYLDTRQQALLLDRVEVLRRIELSPADRKAVLARASEHRAAHSESREPAPWQAVVVGFPTVRFRRRARTALGIPETAN